MPRDPEELLRSIERTREELALTVDTIAGRLDPKRAAKRSIGKVKSGVTGAVDGARLRLHLGQPGGTPVGFSEPTSDADMSPDGHPGGAASAVRTAKDAATYAAKNAAASIRPALQRVPKPVIGGGLAALLALAAILAVRRRRR